MKAEQIKRFINDVPDSQIAYVLDEVMGRAITSIIKEVAEVLKVDYNELQMTKNYTLYHGSRYVGKIHHTYNYETNTIHFQFLP